LQDSELKNNGNAPNGKVHDMSPEGKRHAGGNFEGHVILSLNDTEFRSTPVDSLMQQYGVAQGGGSCDGDFGMGLIKRWRGAAKPYCVPRSNESSAMTCHLVRQTRHHGGGDQLCLGRNVRIDTSPFESTQITDKVLKNYIGSKQADAAYIHYSKGALGATCDPDMGLWKPSAFPGWNIYLLDIYFLAMMNRSFFHQIFYLLFWSYCLTYR
jgi:hypothetical protein